MYRQINHGLKYKLEADQRFIWIQILTKDGMRNIRLNSENDQVLILPEIPEWIPALNTHLKPDDQTGVNMETPETREQIKSGKKGCGCKKKKDKEEKLPPPPPKTSMIDKVKGAVKLATAELGIDDVSLEVLQTRRDTCQSCDLNDFGRCMSCGCYLWAKTRLKKESCPIGKW